MKARVTILLTVFVAVTGSMMLAGCGRQATSASTTTQQDVVPDSETESASVSGTNEVAEEPPGTEEKWDRIPMVMVNDKLYYDTGLEGDASERCGNMDGEITSTVDGSEIPTENNQSNFGAGYGYQYGLTSNTIEILIDDKWYIYENREETDTDYGVADLPLGMYLSVKEIKDGVVTLEIDNRSGYEMTYGEHFILEAYKDGEWESVPMLEGTAVHDIAYNIPDLQKNEMTINLHALYGELEPGHYRFVQDDMLAEFDLQTGEE